MVCLTVTAVTMTNEFEFGPKMRVLTEKQRAFVMAMVEFPNQTHADAARMAGYSDAGDGCKVRACNLLQDKRIVEALQEQAGKKLWAISLKAASRLERLLDSEDDVVALRATGMVLDRVGHAAAQNINIHQHVTDESGKVILDRIQALSEKLGVPVRQLLAKPAVPVVDVEFSEVEIEK